MTNDQPHQAADDATENVLIESIVPAHAHLELQVVKEGQSEFRFPFLKEEIDLGSDAAVAFPEGSSWIARLEGGTVELKHRESDQKLLLAIGQHVEVEGRRIWLVDARQPPLGTLEGMTAPLTGRVWHLKSQQSWLGRKGKRHNHVELDHPTISRAHATFLPNANGRVSLLSESAGSGTAVNGQVLEPGVIRPLDHGDLLSFGQLTFRFSSQLEASGAESLLSIKSLGEFGVSLGTQLTLEKGLRNEKARWLLAYLAAHWGQSVPVESLMSKFWPDATTLRSRKNLSYNLRQLKESLGLEDDDYSSLLLRTPSTLQLNPERLATHDYVEVKKLVSSRQALTSEVALNRLLSLYRGPYLAGCYDDWAEVLRTKLEVEVVETLLATARYGVNQGQDAMVNLAAQRLLTIDPLNEQPTILLMESALKNGEPESAVAAYESALKGLKAEGLEPDTEMMKLYYRASMGL